MTQVDTFAELAATALLDAAVEQTVSGGPDDGQTERVIPLAVALDILANQVPRPEVSAQYAEVRAPALILVDTPCPNCGIHSEVGVTVGGRLTVDPDGGELGVKAKAKGVKHHCGQLTFRDVTPADEGQMTLAAIRCPTPGCVAPVDHRGDHEYSPAEEPDDAGKPPRKPRKPRKEADDADTQPDTTDAP